MNEDEKLLYWEKHLKGKDSLRRQCLDEICNADTEEERAFFYRILKLIEKKY